jgi:hypothetical protein
VLEAVALPVTAIAEPERQFPLKTTEFVDVEKLELDRNVNAGAVVKRSHTTPTDPTFPAASVCVNV